MNEPGDGNRQRKRIMTTEAYRFGNLSMWHDAPDAKHWWMSEYFITRNGKEVKRFHRCGCLPVDALKSWSRLTGLKQDGKTLHPKYGHTYSKDGVPFTSASIKDAASFHLTTFIPVAERERIDAEQGGWNWQFDAASQTGFSPLIDARYISNR